MRKSCERRNMWASTMKKIAGTKTAAASAATSGEARARARIQRQQLGAEQVGGGKPAGDPERGG